MTSWAYNSPMFRLTREVRFALNDLPDDQHNHPPSNSFGGYPSLTGLGQYFELQVTLEGNLDSKSCYLRNIKDVDTVVRDRIVTSLSNTLDVSSIFTALSEKLKPSKLHSITLLLSPFLSLTQLASEFPTHTRLNQRFEFSAAHRLHNSTLSDDENRKTYGKCN